MAVGTEEEAEEGTVAPAPPTLAAAVASFSMAGTFLSVTEAEAVVLAPPWWCIPVPVPVPSPDGETTKDDA